MTRLKPAQVVGLLLLCMVITLLSADLLAALAARPCPAGPDCFPWGAEGPAAGSWSYASKSNYLMRGFAQLGLLASAGAFLIWKAGSDHVLSRAQRAAAFAALGTAALLLFV